MLSGPCPDRSCLEQLENFRANSFLFFFLFCLRQMDDAVSECVGSNGTTRGLLHRTDDDLSPPQSPSSRGDLLPCSQLPLAQPPPLRHLGAAHYFPYWGDLSFQCTWTRVWTRTDSYCPHVTRKRNSLMVWSVCFIRHRRDWNCFFNILKFAFLFYLLKKKPFYIPGL